MDLPISKVEPETCIDGETLKELHCLNLRVVPSRFADPDFFDAFRSLLDHPVRPSALEKSGALSKLSFHSTLEELTFDFVLANPKQFGDPDNLLRGATENGIRTQANERLMPMAFMKMLDLPASFISDGEYTRFDSNQLENGLLFARGTDPQTGKNIYFATANYRPHAQGYRWG